MVFTVFRLLTDFVCLYTCLYIYHALFLFFFSFKDMHYNTMIRTFCIMKKMTFSAFHYLNLLIRCEELDAYIN
jgi:hypothetical protein